MASSPSKDPPIVSEPRRRKLTKEAYVILATFFDTVSRYPAVAQCKELADAVRKLPGCEWCTEMYVKTHMMNRRGTEQRRVTRRRARLESEPSKSSEGSTEPALRGLAPEYSSRAASSASPVEALQEGAHYAYPMLLLNPSAYMAHISAQVTASNALIRHTWRTPLIPSLTFAATASTEPPVPLRTPASPPKLQVASSSTLSPDDPRLHDLAARLEQALAGSSATQLCSDNPKTLADLSRLLGEQQANIDGFLLALDGGAYAGLGLSPMASGALLENSRRLKYCSVHGASGTCSLTMRGLGCGA